MPTIGGGLNWNYSDSSTGDSDARNVAMQLTPSGSDSISGSPTIGTTEETLALGDVSSVGVVVIKNLDTTNYVEYGTVTGQRGSKISPGGIAVFEAKNNNVFIKADTAPCRIRYWIYSA